MSDNGICVTKASASHTKENYLELKVVDGMRMETEDSVLRNGMTS